MTISELTALPSYANHTYGQPHHPLACVVCRASPGPAQPMDAGGRCVRCARKLAPSREVVVLFKPPHRKR